IEDNESVGMDNLLARARVFTIGGGKEVVVVASKGLTAAKNHQTLRHQHDLLSGRKEETCGFRDRCFMLGDPEMSREFKEPKPDIICYLCIKPGHKATHCNQRNTKEGLLRQRLPSLYSKGASKYYAGVGGFGR
ncbi:hypothetical protein SK128_021052, partial [Halocaridina rubra]